MKKHVLLIDDDEVFHYLNSKIISLSGIECVIQTALDGRKAIDLLRTAIREKKQLPEYIFLDLEMPVMDGFQFITAFGELKKEIDATTKIAIVTSSESIHDKQRAYALGIANFFSKPLTEENVREIFAE